MIDFPDNLAGNPLEPSVYVQTGNQRPATLFSTSFRQRHFRDCPRTWPNAPGGMVSCGNGILTHSFIPGGALTPSSAQRRSGNDSEGRSPWRTPVLHPDRSAGQGGRVPPTVGLGSPVSSSTGRYFLGPGTVLGRSSTRRARRPVRRRPSGRSRRRRLALAPGPCTLAIPSGHRVRSSGAAGREPGRNPGA